MKTRSLRKVAAALTCLAAAHVAAAVNEKDSVVTAVFSRSFNKYERPTRADGSNQPLTYVVAKGGAEAGMYPDQSMDDVRFAGIVRMLGKYLAKEAYFPANDGKKADLMLVIHWGKTIPFSDALSRNMLDQGLQRFSELRLNEVLGDDAVQGLMEIRFAQDARIAADRHNANLLGYTSELNRRDNPSLYAGAGTAYHDLISDLESERYYVAVTAYDFQEALQHKNKKGLWRTVASIDARDNRFDERLVTMIDKASKYFGRDTERLIRQFDYTPRINFGELKTLGVVDAEPSSKK
ncbi:MAG: hypothetical protein ABIZ04_01970 [Opitutus sp.]